MGRFYILAILLTQCIWLVSSQTARVGSFFVHQVKRSELFPTGSDGDLVDLHASTVNFPDLPKWLRFVQRSPSQDGYLYGTPDSPQTVDIQMVGTNRNTFESTKSSFKVKVVDGKNALTKFIELPVTNTNPEDMFAAGVLANFINRAQEAWPEAGTFEVYKVSGFLEEGGRTPVPDIPGKIVKEGTIVILGTSGGSLAVESCTSSSYLSAMRDIFEPQFVIRWCDVKVLEAQMVLPTEETALGLKAIPALASQFNISKPSEPRDLSGDFIAVIIVPCVVSIILFFILSIIMFGGREGRDNRERMTPDHQLQEYSSIRRATAKLRQMSTQRQEPLPPTPLSTPDFGHPRGHSTPGSQARSFTPNSQRSTPGSEYDRHSQPPPPYRIQPLYQPNYTDNSLRTPGSGDHSGMEDDVQLVR